MENVTNGILMALLLVVGIFSGTLLFQVEKEVEVIKEVPVNVIVEKIVEVPAECEECEVPVDLLQLAVDEFMEAVDNEEDEAGNEVDALSGYEFDEITIKKISEDWTVTYSEDTTTVDFGITLKYRDKHDTERETYNVKVVFEDDEDTEVTIA